MLEYALPRAKNGAAVSSEGEYAVSPCVVVVDHLGEALGAYCYRRVIKAFPENGIEFRCIEAWRGMFPEDVEEWVRDENVAAVVLDGAHVSPLDRESWIGDEGRFLKKLIPLGIPVLAICFGHELLAAELGGALRRRAAHETAMHVVNVLKSDPIFDGLGEKFLMPFCHEVEMEKMPPEYTLLATAEYSEIQVMRHERFPVYSVQFHPEADAEIKRHDPDWDAVSDAGFSESKGDAFMKNFARIALNTSVSPH